MENIFEGKIAGVQQNVILREMVSLRVGGVADYFVVAETIEELKDAVLAAFSAHVPYFILAGGNNVVPSDSGFPGLVIKNETNNMTFSPESTTVVADSGVNLGKLINLAAGRDLGGLEFLFGVPGTVGGAIYGNAGAHQHSIGDFVKSVTLILPSEEGLRVEKKEAGWMEFDYRGSKLKSDYLESPNKPVILTATLQLAQRRKDEIMRQMQESISYKKDNQPMGELSAGSFFKNPENQQAAGYLLEQAGAKKIRVGGAAFSKKHANFLINRHDATASDVRDLAEKAKELVHDKFNVNLKEEVEYIGKW